MWVDALRTLVKNIDRYKAWFVIRGNHLKERVQFSDRWAPTGRSAILCYLFAMAAKFGWEIWSFDISGAYLNAKLKTAVYNTQSPGFDDGSDRVWYLNCALYGLPHIGNTLGKRKCQTAVSSLQGWRTFLATQGSLATVSDLDTLKVSRCWCARAGTRSAWI
jgi:hypothetical protein